MAFTEFYMLAGGSNLNAGSTSSTIPAYNSAAGNWTNATRIFTPTDGLITSSFVNVGDFASIYVTAGATATGYIGRVTAVGAGVNGTITISATVSIGNNPSNGTGTITCRVGGAWSGPSGTVSFPLTAISGTLSALLNVNGDAVRINVKNDQTYAMTTQLLINGVGACQLQGFTSTPGDGGKATFTNNTVATSGFQASGNAISFIDLNFVNLGASSNNHLFVSSGSHQMLRCVFSGARGAGYLQSTSGQSVLIECEAFGNYLVGGSGGAGFLGQQGTMICINCYSHDNVTGTTNGFGVAATPGSLILINCISESNSGSGVQWGLASAVGTNLVVINCDIYNNTVDGIKIDATTAGCFAYIGNNNFLKNGGKAINNTLVSQAGILYNNGRGSGTQSNGSSDTLGSIINTNTDVTYSANLTPWVSPTTGNFSINLSAAIGAGRGAFTETDGVNSGTVGYPDIGAAQSIVNAGAYFAGLSGA